MSLPLDVSRCTGMVADDASMHEECVTCARRTDITPPGVRVPLMAPPVVIVFGCPFYIGDE